MLEQPNQGITSHVDNEGDVRRVVAQLAGIVEQAWIGMINDSPKVWHIWEAGPPGPGAATAETVDSYWGVKMPNGYQRCAAIGEFKRPGVIKAHQWRSEHPSTPTVRLGKEIRMYAFQYNCTHAYYFDAYYLVLLRFASF